MGRVLNKYLIIILLLLGGCTTTIPVPSYQTQYNTNTIEEPFGVIVGSLARDPSSHRYDVQKFHFENIETEKRYSLALTPMGGKQYRDRFDHFSTVEATGDVYQFQLPVGRYRFYNFYLNIKQPDGRRSWAAQEDYSIPFEVTANEVKYLGEIKQIPFFGSSFLGLRNYAGSTWVISNKFERDIGVLKAEFPNLSLDNMVHLVLKSLGVGNCLILRKIVTFLVGLKKYKLMSLKCESQVLMMGIGCLFGSPKF